MNEKEIQAKIELQAVEDMAGRRALAEPFPGALADTFSLAPNIKVGPFEVRRFRDGDFKLLNALKNPFHDFMLACMLGDKEGVKNIMKPTGQPMWDLAYIFTKPAKEVAEEIKSHGVAAVQASAEEKFSEFRYAALTELLMAIIEQAMIYSTANISYKDGEEKEGEAGSENPPLSAAQ